MAIKHVVDNVKPENYYINIHSVSLKNWYYKKKPVKPQD